MSSLIPFDFDGHEVRFRVDDSGSSWVVVDDLNRFGLPWKWQTWIDIKPELSDVIWSEEDDGNTLIAAPNLAAIVAYRCGRLDLATWIVDEFCPELMSKREEFGELYDSLLNTALDSGLAGCDAQVAAVTAFCAVTGVDPEPFTSAIHREHGRLPVAAERFVAALNTAFSQPPMHGPSRTKYYVYFARRPDGFIKIGTSTDPVLRVRGIGLQSGLEIEIIGLQYGTREDEAVLHRRFSAQRSIGEWFAPSPELLGYISSNATVEVLK